MACTVADNCSRCLFPYADEVGIVTIKAFAKKYGVPMSIAFEASYDVQPKATMERDKDFDEQEMYDSLVKILDKREDKLFEQYYKIVKMIREVRRIERSGRKRTETM